MQLSAKKALSSVPKTTHTEYLNKLITFYLKSLKQVAIPCQLFSPPLLSVNRGRITIHTIKKMAN